MYIMFQCSIYMYDISIYRSIDQSVDLSIYLPIIYLPIYLSTYLPIYLSTYLPIYLSTYLPIYLSTYLPIYLSTYLPIYLSTYLPIYLSIYLSTYLSICLSIYLSTYLPTYLSVYIYIYLYHITSIPRDHPSKFRSGHQFQLHHECLAAGQPMAQRPPPLRPAAVSGCGQLQRPWDRWRDGLMASWRWKNGGCPGENKVDFLGKMVDFLGKIWWI